MKKQFVTYEIALALKELGFDDPCILGLSTLGVSRHKFTSPMTDDDYIRWDKYDTDLSIPLWQQVIDYFRTKHNIVIELTRFEHTDDIVEWVYIIEEWDGNVIVEYNDCEHFKTYEEAREAAVLMAIELLKGNKGE